MAVLRLSPVDLPHVPILLHDTFIKALWDIGAEKSFIRTSCLSHILPIGPRKSRMLKLSQHKVLNVGIWAWLNCRSEFENSRKLIPDSKIKGVPQREEQVEIDLSHTKLDDYQQEIDVKAKDLVLVQMHPISLASKRIGAITVNVDQVLIYHPREKDEGVVETDGLDGEGSRAEQVETEGSKGLAREESTKEEQWRSKRMRNEG
ncbi:hypothetical protein NPIL_136351 [Nephila pilipes]|uniref:Uncharacterized protein n=1 Tax=Nephila pilipes TaxID=299642 RepID=A0A8X6UMD6_NEPPI|nr:hypothetical protein NPIL_136351 [Nephila pilipes]